MKIESQFIIQKGCPRVTGSYDPGDELLDEAMDTAFVYMSENAWIRWNNEWCRLSYKYDLSEMMDVLITMISGLVESDEGSSSLYFSTDLFHAQWNYKWKGDDLEIEADWSSAKKGQHLDPILNASRKAFIAEWLELFKVVQTGLSQCGYGSNVTGPLDEIIEHSEGDFPRGQLYGGCD